MSGPVLTEPIITTGPVVTGPIGPGAFVAVVGASGAGKDALLSYAREQSDARFPRRVITRPPGPGEDHDPVTEEQFAAALGQGAFAVHWDAHGLRYGIPAAADGDIRDGRVVVANVSRAVLGELDARYQRLVVVRVTVSEEVRAQRLRARRREDGPGVGQRLARPDPAPGHRVDVVIQNDGTIAEGGATLLGVIRAATANAPAVPAPGPRRGAATADHLRAGSLPRVNHAAPADPAARRAVSRADGPTRVSPWSVALLRCFFFVPRGGGRCRRRPR